MSSVIEVRGVATNKIDTFPYSAMRVLGSIQICIAVLVFVLGVIDLVLTLMSYKIGLEDYGSRFGLVVTLTVASCPLWCGLWFAVSGALGTFMTPERAHSLQYFKAGFLILNVLCCALFAPVCAAIAGFTSYARHDLIKDSFQWLLTLSVCFLAVLEAVIATVSAAVTCCCSTLKSVQVHVMVDPRGLIEQNDEPIGDRKSSSVSRSSQVNSDDVVNNSNNGSNSNNNSNSSNNGSNNGITHNDKSTLVLPRRDNRRRRRNSNPRGRQSHTSTEANGYTPRQRPRVEIHEPISDWFGFTSDYNKWHKWSVHSP